MNGPCGRGYGSVSWDMSQRVRAQQATRSDVRFCLVFEREKLSVPAMRQVLGDILRRLGVNDDSVADILLAASEACADGCRVEVTDDEVFSPGPAAVADLAESGRGFAVMRACVDGVWLRSEPGQRTSVVLDKRIRWEPTVPVLA